MENPSQLPLISSPSPAFPIAESASSTLAFSSIHPSICPTFIGHLICPSHCARFQSQVGQNTQFLPSSMLSAFPPHISGYVLYYIPEKSRKHCFHLEKDRDMLRAADKELSQLIGALVIGASDYFGYHGWAWWLNSDLLFLQAQNQIVYFIRQALVPVTPKNFEATVQFGTVRGSYIPALLRLLSGVFAPQIFTNTTWPESIRNHFASHLHRFLACLTGEQKDLSASFPPRAHLQQSQWGSARGPRLSCTEQVLCVCWLSGRGYRICLLIQIQFSAVEWLTIPPQT